MCLRAVIYRVVDRRAFVRGSPLITPHSIRKIARCVLMGEGSVCFHVHPLETGLSRLMSTFVDFKIRMIYSPTLHVHCFSLPRKHIPVWSPPRSVF